MNNGTNAGRHSAGAPIAKSGTKPQKRTGRATGSVVGTGVNNKTAANTQYSGAQPKSGVNSQAETWLNQAPAPFDNAQASSHPRKYSTSTTVSPNGYEATGGQRAGSGGYGKAPQANANAASRGSAKGHENGNVIGPKKPARKGNVYNQPNGSSAGGYKGRGGAPSFYGR